MRHSGLVSSSSKKNRRSTPPPDPTPLPGLIDAHTHLAAYGGRTPEAVHAILDHAEAVGVSHVVTVADDMVDARWALKAAHWDSRAFAAVGLHPTHAADLDDASRAEIEAMVADERVVAIGETGLDYYWTTRSDDCAAPSVQRDAFAWHIDLAKRSGKTLMIHNREADRDLLDVLAAEGSPDTVVMHCFSGDRAIAAECVDRNYYLSFSGTVTFANSDELRAAADITPTRLMLVETDAPFLTPHPYRGQPNQSYCLPYTARGLAAVKGLEDEEIATILGANAARAYSLSLR
ncbi:TatD family hydrolase [Gordonia sp. (in: high G+C Gram-positive bacteria)]|uniref:TatD family hydrolase n=1 Tax=Gordonia sp. (in: high G+C Gram-positive bacteria) TaxID=84139 RepID=UPI003F959612